MKIESLSSNRSFIYYLLRRSVRFHAPISFTCIFDITALEAEIKSRRSQGEAAGLVAAFIKATALCLKKYPRLNQRLFHNFWGFPRLVTFDEISCNTVVGREAEGGEPIVLPMVLRNVDAMAVADIQQAIRHYKTAALTEIEAVGKLNKISKLPGWMSRFLHWRFRREPKFLISSVGTYGVSALPSRGGLCTATFSPVPQTAFFPTSIQEQVLVIDGKPTVRTTLTCTMTADHYVVDGLDLQKAGMLLQKLIENPERLFNS